MFTTAGTTRSEPPSVGPTRRRRRVRQCAAALGVLVTLIASSGARVAAQTDDVAPEISIDDLQAFQDDGEIWWLISFEDGINLSYLRQLRSATFSCETATTKVGWEWHEGVETTFLLDRGFVLIDGDVVLVTGIPWNPADSPIDVRCLSASWEDESTEAQFSIHDFTIDPADVPEQLVDELVKVWDFSTGSPIAPPTEEEVQAAEAFLRAELHDVAADVDQGDGQLWMNVTIIDESGEAVDVLSSPSAIYDFLATCDVSINGEAMSPGDGDVGWLEDGSILFDTGLSLLDVASDSIGTGVDLEIDPLVIESTCLTAADSEIPLPDDLVTVEGLPAAVVPFAPLSGAAFWELVTGLVVDPPADDEELATRIEEAMAADGVTALEEDPVVDELLESQEPAAEALEEDPVVDELLESQEPAAEALEEDPVVDELLESQAAGADAPASGGALTDTGDGSASAAGWIAAAVAGTAVVIAVGWFAWKRRSAAVSAETPPG